MDKSEAMLLAVRAGRKRIFLFVVYDFTIMYSLKKISCILCTRGRYDNVSKKLLEHLQGVTVI